MALAGFPTDRYPGRGFVVGRAADGKTRLHLYWLTGRSENSRNRVLVEQDGAIRTATADTSKEGDTSLTVYTALTAEGETHIVGNGDQVDTVADLLRRGGSAQDALRTRSHEPDDPIFTPRITAVDSGGILLLSKISTAGHAFYEPRRLLPGQGFGLRTYSGDGAPVRTFDGDPFEVALDGAPADLAADAWELLDPELRVALVLKEIDPDGSTRHTILNRYERVPG
jgi:IMP cyclohydrolase